MSSKDSVIEFRKRIRERFEGDNTVSSNAIEYIFGAIDGLLTQARLDAKREAIENACKLIDDIEISLVTTLEQWKLFKRIRNTLMDSLKQKPLRSAEGEDA